MKEAAALTLLLIGWGSVLVGTAILLRDDPDVGGPWSLGFLVGALLTYAYLRYRDIFRRS